MNFIKPRCFAYIVGLAGICILNLGFNYIAASGLKLLTDASVNKDMKGLLHSLSWMGIGFAILMVTMPLFSYSFSWVVKKTTGDIRKVLFSHVQKLPVNCIEGEHSGDYISRLTNDVMAAERAYGDQISMLLAAVVSGIGSAIYIFGLSPFLGFLIIVFGALSVLVNSFFIKPLESVSKKSQESISGLTQRLSDLLAGSQISRMFGIRKTIMGKYNLSNGDIRHWNLKRAVINSYLGGINTVFEPAFQIRNPVMK